MKMPSVCPFCKGVLLNEYSGKHQQYLVKQCTKNVTHSIMFRADGEDHNLVHYLSIPLSSTLKVFWYPNDKDVLFDSIRSSTHIPYFDPDLSNYSKLINKLKTYLIFS